MVAGSHLHSLPLQLRRRVRTPRSRTNRSDGDPPVGVAASDGDRPRALHWSLIELVRDAVPVLRATYRTMVIMTLQKILIIDDDRAIRRSLRRALTLEDYDVVEAVDGIQGMLAARDNATDAIILDVMMPGIDGIGVCRLLRAEQVTTPILMLTARVETGDRVAGLDAGADDYLPKPFELDELLARIRALVRRSRITEDAAPDAGLHWALLRISPDCRQAWWSGSELALSKTEFDLLELLVRNAGQVLPHPVIYERIWGYDFGPESNNLAVYISYLRRKLLDAGAPDLIRTVRGVGYGLNRPS